MPGFRAPGVLAASLSFGFFANAKMLRRATNSTYVVHSSINFIVGGEHVPSVGFDDSGKLTSYGANQMFQQGENFRQRYITSNLDHYVAPEAPIQDLSQWVIDYEGLTVWTPNDQALVGSAQAFLQGLYPPVSLNDGSQTVLDGQQLLSNGTYLDYPLSGYQYPQMNSISFFDPNYIYLSGGYNCPAQTRSQVQISNEWEYRSFGQDASDLFLSMESYLSDVFPTFSLNFANAMLIYEFMAYEYNHNSTVFDDLKDRPYETNMERLRIMAFLQQYAMYGNTSADANQIRAVAGRTLAAKIIGLMENNMVSGGTYNKLALLFGDIEPVIAFFSLAKVFNFAQNLWTLPTPGASMMFELFSWQNGTDTGDTYPDVDDLWVRFLYRPGPDRSNQTLAYPLFGNGPSMTDIPWTQFLEQMAEFALGDAGEWCDICNASSLWCQTFMEADGLLNSSPGSSRSSNMTLQVAGVIGAAVTLGLILVAFLILIFLGGLRFNWTKRSRKNTEMGGFKGSTKLPSDTDLTNPKGGASSTVGEAKPRLGSWELKDKDAEMGKFSSLGAVGESGARRPSFEEDDDVDLGRKPTVPDERV